MKNIGEMVGVLELNNKDFMMGMKKSAGTLPNFSKQFKGMGKTVVAISRTITKSIFNIKTMLMSLAGAYVLKKVAGSFLEAASTAEGFRVRLKVLLGSVKEGNKLFKSMAVFASGVSFEYKEIMGGATALAGVMKGGVKEIEKWMPMIADLAAAAGMSIQETIGQVIRMYSAGAAAADMFRERGILAMMGFKAGAQYSAEETRKQMFAAWNAIDSKFKGASKELAKTWDGMISMMRDAWFQFRNMVMEAGIFDFIKNGIKTILEKIKELKEEGKLKEWAEGLARATLGAMERIIQGAGLVVKAFYGWQMIWNGLKGAFAIFSLVVAEGLDKLVWSLKKFYQGYIAILEVQNKLLGWTRILRADVDAYRNAIEALGGAEGYIGQMQEFWNKTLEDSAKGLEEAEGKIRKLEKAISSLIKGLRIGDKTEASRMDKLKEALRLNEEILAILRKMSEVDWKPQIDMEPLESAIERAWQMFWYELQKVEDMEPIELEIEWAWAYPKPPEEEIKEAATEALTAIRSMYEDMRDYGEGYFDIIDKLIDAQAEKYKELVKDGVLVDKWAASEKKRIADDLQESRRRSMEKWVDVTMDNWTYVFQQLGKKSRTAFETFKRMQQVQAVIDAIRTSLAAFKWGWEYGGPVAPYVAVAAAAGAWAAAFAKVAMIESQEYQGHAVGGWLDEHPKGGKIKEGAGGRDDVFLGASPGIRHWGMKDEFIFVLNKDAVKKYGVLLEAMNQGLAKGGWIDRGYGILGDIGGAITMGVGGMFGLGGATGIPVISDIVDWLEDIYEALTAPPEIPEIPFDPEVFEGILHSIDKMLGNTSALDDALYSANQQFDGWIKQLEEMNATQEQLAQVESQREEVLSRIEAEMVAEAWEDVNQQISQLTGTLSDFEWQIIGVNDQFDSMIDQLEDINATEAELAAVEAQRAVAILHLVNAQRETLEESLTDRLAELTLAPGEATTFRLLKEFMATIEQIQEWSEVTGEGYEDLVEQATRVYRLEMEAALEQSKAAQEIKSAVSAWMDAIENIDRTIYEMQSTLTSPRNVLERMQYVMDQILAFGEITSPEDLNALQQLWVDYLNLAQEAYQRPSVEYQAIYDTVLGVLEDLKEQAEGFISGYEINLEQLVILRDILTTEQGMATSLDEIAMNIMAGIPVDLALATEDFEIIMDIPAAEEIAGAIGTIEVPTIPPVDVDVSIPPVDVMIDSTVMQTQNSILEQIRSNTYATARNLLTVIGQDPQWITYPQFAKEGAIFHGPESGYPVMMHGREAVVKLQDGLNMEDLGRTELNLNVSIDGSRSPRDTAIETRKELENFLRSSRGRRVVKQAGKGKI